MSSVRHHCLCLPLCTFQTDSSFNNDWGNEGWEISFVQELSPLPHNVIDTRSKTYLCCRRGLTCMIHWGCEDKFFHVNLMLCISPAVSLDLQMEWWETWNLSFYHQKVDFSPHAFHKLLFLLELGIIDERRMVGMQNTVERRVTFPSNS